ncbi:hypothetical protein GOODEAATRI_012203, partial [Goodea atripinnis]
VAVATLSPLKQPAIFDKGGTRRLDSLTHPPSHAVVWLLPRFPPHGHHPSPVLFQAASPRHFHRFLWRILRHFRICTCEHVSTAFTRLKEVIGWRYCLVVLGVMQASVIGFGVLLRPITIESEPVKEDSDSDSLSLKQIQSDYELENEQTRTSLSSAISQGSGDSGVTSLSTSDEDLGNAEAEAKALMGWGDQDKEILEKSASMPPSAPPSTPPSTPPSPVKEELDVELSEGEACPLQPSTPKLLDFSMLKDGAFIWYSLFGLFATLGFFAPQLYIIELSKSRGVEPSMASYMLSVMAVAEIFGRFSIGVVLNKVRCKKTHVLLGCVILMSLVLVAFTIVWEFWGLLVCCALYGFFMGTVGSTHIPLLAEEEVVGIQKLPSCVGVYIFIQSFAGLAGPPLGGKVSFFCCFI